MVLGARRREPGSQAYAEPSGRGIGKFRCSRDAVQINTQPPRGTFAERSLGHLMAVERSSPERPLAAHGAIMAAYTLTFVGPLAFAARRGALPERPRFADLALVGVGTFKLSRLLTTDAVTGVIRAPFVRYEGMEGATSPKESPRGKGVRRAIGQLLLCPVCTGMWVASALTAALVTSPRATRLACGALTVAAASDFLQSAHEAAAPDDGERAGE